MWLHEVITPEKVPFYYRVAGLGSRFLAWLIDLGVIVLLIFVGLLVGAVLESGRGGMALAIVALWSFVLQWGYFILFEWLWHGQTPGKRLLGIRVINRQGTSVTFLEAAVRNLLRVVDGMPLLIIDVVPLLYGVGFLVAACNRENRRLGDLAAGTLVVHVQHRVKPIRAVHEAVSERDRAREALVRQRMEQLTRPQKQTILDLCLRRDQLRVQDRTRLFAAMAAYLQNRLGLVAEEFQSDEKFVLQLASVLSAGVGELAPAGRKRGLPLPEVTR
jgi:uncharacterized RDD family membrane protein YckC